MIARKKTYNRIARSFRLKPSPLIYLFFFLEWETHKKAETEARRDIPAEYFHRNKLV